MFRLSSIRPYFVPAMFVAVVLAALWPTDGATGRLYQAVARPLHSLAETVIGPGARAFAWIGSGIGGNGERPVYIEDLERLNDELLWRDNLILRLEAELRRLQQENAALQDLSRRFDRQSYVFRLADVTGRLLAPATRTLSIDIGRRQGIIDGSAVVDGPNLVGRIISVGQLTSTVHLISSPGSRLDVIFTPPVWAGPAPPPERLARRAQIDSMNDGRFEGLVTEDMLVDVGDLAHLRDTAWPEAAQGMIIGRVIEVQRVHDPPLRKRVVVQPLRELSRLDEVTVILPRTNSTLNPEP